MESRDFIDYVDLTKEQIEILSENEDSFVRGEIAFHPDLPKDLMYKMAEDKDVIIRRGIAEHSDLPEDLIIRFSCDSDWDTHLNGFIKLEKLNNLKSEDLEKTYDLIRVSKYIGRKYFEKTFDYIISNFPELSEAAKLFKSIILKGKRDMK